MTAGDSRSVCWSGNRESGTRSVELDMTDARSGRVGPRSGGTFGSGGGSIRFADLEAVSGDGYSGETMDLAGTVTWTCGPARNALEVPATD